ncbi:glycerophosphoryl diester phosphodiesterase [Marmoricola endophyticus]|uniref:glycerophosphodiester phosphodiesterase n=2 Tax=Marmoricola endophyticus TaxID=2040280 RepID=A0A917BUN3_9ACTN|nr:glycerophosphoryl diester phosphodiesterase [Marmoricola endophyticus]
MTRTGPLVIGHRGASGHRPEHTAAAYRLALRLGADSVELDLLPTRDGVLVCRHDLELSRTTDVARRPELAHLRRTLEVDGEELTGWFVHDLTWAQLSTLRCTERWPRKRPFSASYDGRYPVLPFAKLCDLVDRESERAGRRLGVHAELKHPDFLESSGFCVPELLDALPAEQRERPRLSWMSFDDTVLRRMAARGTRRPLVQLYAKTPKGRHLGDAATYAQAVGVRRKAVLPRENGRVGRSSDLVAKAARRGLDVLVWTHRAENTHLPRSLRVGTSEFGHGLAAEEARLLFEAGVSGLISDVPDVAALGRSKVAGTRAG